jgi:hypothetical protein
MANSWVILGFRKMATTGLYIHGVRFQQNRTPSRHTRPRRSGVESSVHQRNPEIGLVPGSCVPKQAPLKSHIPQAQLGGAPDLHFYPYLLPVSQPLFSKLSHWDRMANSGVILGFRKMATVGLCIHGGRFRENSVSLCHFHPGALASRPVCIGGTRGMDAVALTSAPNPALRKFHLTQARVGRSLDLHFTHSRLPASQPLFPKRLTAVAWQTRGSFSEPARWRTRVCLWPKRAPAIVLRVECRTRKSIPAGRQSRISPFEPKEVVRDELGTDAGGA